MGTAQLAFVGERWGATGSHVTGDRKWRQMFSSTSWNSKCPSFRSPNQDVLQTVSTTARYDFKGVTLDDLVVLGQVFRLNVHVYDLQKTEAGDITTRLVRSSPYSFEDTTNLNLHEDHFSYVSNMEKYSHSYPCLKCDRLWKHVGTLYRHERTCTGSVTSFIDVQDIAWQTSSGS